MMPMMMRVALATTPPSSHSACSPYGLSCFDAAGLAGIAGSAGDASGVGAGVAVAVAPGAAGAAGGGDCAKATESGAPASATTAMAVARQALRAREVRLANDWTTRVAP